MLPIIISAIESPEDRDLMIDFYTQYNVLLYNEAQKYIDIREDIEDIVYEALATIIDKMDVFRELKGFQKAKYAITTVRNLSYYYIKRNNRFKMIPFETLEYEMATGDGVTTEEVVEKKLFWEHIQRIWTEINIEDRVLLVQKYILKWSDEEIAKLIEMQPQSVRMRLTRAKRNVVLELRKRGVSIADVFNFEHVP